MIRITKESNTKKYKVCSTPELGQKKKKKSYLVVLHRLPLILENWTKVFTVQKYTATYFQK